MVALVNGRKGMPDKFQRMKRRRGPAQLKVGGRGVVKNKTEKNRIAQPKQQADDIQKARGSAQEVKASGKGGGESGGSPRQERGKTLFPKSDQCLRKTSSGL